MKLNIGKMKTKELIEWFGISASTFRNNSKKYYDILNYYCDYEKDHGGIDISAIHIEVYNKHLIKENVELFKNTIRDCVKT